jgi:hypothetical protein
MVLYHEGTKMGKLHKQQAPAVRIARLTLNLNADTEGLATGGGFFGFSSSMRGAFREVFGAMATQAARELLTAQNSWSPGTLSLA